MLLLVLCVKGCYTLRWRAALAPAYMLGGGLGLAAVSLGGGYAIVAQGHPSLFLAAAAVGLGGVLLLGVLFRSPICEQFPREQTAVAERLLGHERET